jgi:hypothetical protein
MLRQSSASPQKLGMVFYTLSPLGCCIYYFQPTEAVFRQIKLTTEMPFRKAATIVHGLNKQLFECSTDENEVPVVVYDYLIAHGAQKNLLRSQDER